MLRVLSALLVYLLALPPGLAAAVVPVAVHAPVGGVPTLVAGVAPASASQARLPARTGLSLDFTLGPSAIPPISERAERELKRKLDDIAAVRPEEATFDNTVGALEKAYAEYGETMYPVSFLSSVSPDPAVRETVDGVQDRASEFLLHQGARQDVYDAIRSYADKGERLEGEDKKLLDETMLDYRHSGMDLELPERSRFKWMEKRLSDLGRAFERNLREATDAVDLRPEELAGVPEDVLGTLQRAPGGKLRVPLTEEATYASIMRYADNGRTRRRLYYRMQRVASKENLRIMREMLSLRHSLAKTLGYRDFAHLALEGRMAKSPRRVWRFLHRLRRLLKGAADSERDEILERKKRERPKATKLYPWDYGHYGFKHFKETMDFDPDVVREYFPVDHVVPETLKIYEELHGIEFREVEARGWHPDVRRFEIRDAKTGVRIAHVYLDLFPRPGKESGAFAATIIQGRELPDGSYREPVSAIVANFEKTAPGRPALLRHHEVKTFFHEFGHVMHQTLTTARRPSFSGAAVAMDFAEAPSQAMENFVWERKIIERLSAHYAAPSRKLPPKMIKKLLEMRNYHSATDTLSQAALAALDLAYHSTGQPDLLRIFRRIEKYYTGQEPNQASTFPARFDHIMGNYAAAYYGYLWSRVYAQDIYSVFKANGVLSPRVGARYRATILANGGAIDENVLIRMFLGRDPNEEAFLKWLGLVPRS